MNIQQEFLEKLRDVEMDVTVRFGQTELPLRDVAALGGGSMIELNRTIDDPVELLVNNCPFARGEVVVVDGYYSVRVTEVSPPEKSPNTFLAGALNASAKAPAADNAAPPASGAPPAAAPGGQNPAGAPPKGAKPAAPQSPTGQKPPPAAPKPPAQQKPPVPTDEKPKEG